MLRRPPEYASLGCVSRVFITFLSTTPLLPLIHELLSKYRHLNLQGAEQLLQVGFIGCSEAPALAIWRIRLDEHERPGCLLSRVERVDLHAVEDIADWLTLLTRL